MITQHITIHETNKIIRVRTYKVLEDNKEYYYIRSETHHACVDSENPFNTEYSYVLARPLKYWINVNIELNSIYSLHYIHWNFYS